MKTKLPHIICLLALLVFHSCSHDDFDRGKDKSSHSVGEARAYFENNATNLTMPLLLMPASTKNEDIFAEGNLVPVWKDCAVAETDRFSIFEVPIARDFAMEAAMFHHGNGIHSFVTENVKVCSSLVIRKNRTTGTADFFVVTTIGFLTAQGNRDDNPWKYMGDRANFNGYMIISNVEGEVLEAFYYRGGNRYFISLTNHVHGGSAGIDLFGFTVRRTAPITKGGGWYDPGESQELCPHCKRPLIDYICDCPGWLDNTVVTGEYIYCDGCGMLKGKCICGDNSCPVCGKEPCECSESSSCPLCGSRYCNGECSDLGSGERGGGDEPEPPQNPANPIDTTGYSKSNIIPCVMYDSQETMDAIEPTITLLANGGNSSKIMEYIKRQNIPVIFESVPTLFNAYETIPGVGKTSGQLKYIRIKFYDGAEFRLGEILHEFTHGWYKMMYPGVSLNNNMNSEAISTIAEYLSSLDYSELEHHFKHLDGLNKNIPSFWNNPCPETFEKLRQSIIDRSKFYESFILDETTFYKQIDDFKNLFK